jgi:hypothetical protein
MGRAPRRFRLARPPELIRDRSSQRAASSSSVPDQLLTLLGALRLGDLLERHAVDAQAGRAARHDRARHGLAHLRRDAAALGDVQDLHAHQAVVGHLLRQQVEDRLAALDAGAALQQHALPQPPLGPDLDQPLRQAGRLGPAVQVPAGEGGLVQRQRHLDPQPPSPGRHLEPDQSRALEPAQDLLAPMELVGHLQRGRLPAEHLDRR